MATADAKTWGVDAIFVLGCGCLLDGCSDSDPGLKWRAGVRNGLLYCVSHREWVSVTGMVSMEVR